MILFWQIEAFPSIQNDENINKCWHWRDNCNFLISIGKRDVTEGDRFISQIRYFSFERSFHTHMQDKNNIFVKLIYFFGFYVSKMAIDEDLFRLVETNAMHLRPRMV